MKYTDFKRYKFFKVLKNINFSRYIKFERYLKVQKYVNFRKFNFSGIYKYINFKRYSFFDIYKYINFRRYSFFDIFKYINFRRYSFSNIYKYTNFRRYSFPKIYKYLNLKKLRYIPVYISGIILFSFFIYLNVPLFFNFDRSIVEKEICEDFNTECTIQGKIKYSFFPTPRIKLNNFIIKDFIENDKIFAKIKNTAIKLSLYNLLDKKNLNFTHIELKDFEINFDLEKSMQYKNFLKKQFITKPLNFKEGQIKFFDGEKYVATIENVNFETKSLDKIDEVILRGNFLGEALFLDYKNKKKTKRIEEYYYLKTFKLEIVHKNKHISSEGR